MTEIMFMLTVVSLTFAFVLTFWAVAEVVIRIWEEKTRGKK